jgi:hypothetical protein
MTTAVRVAAALYLAVLTGIVCGQKNADEPRRTVQLSGRVADGNGGLIKNGTVVLKLDGSTDNTARINKNGEFTLSAPSFQPCALVFEVPSFQRRIMAVTAERDTELGTVVLEAEALATEQTKSIVKLSSGDVTLPMGFAHERLPGIDSELGRFTSPDGKLIIHYDIGGMAGVYVKRTAEFTETRINGTTMLIRVRGRPRDEVVVSFPTEGPTNFFAEVRDSTDIETVKSIAMSFKPVARIRRIR